MKFGIEDQHQIFIGEINFGLCRSNITPTYYETNIEPFSRDFSKTVNRTKLGSRYKIQVS